MSMMLGFLTNETGIYPLQAVSYRDVQFALVKKDKSWTVMSRFDCFEPVPNGSEKSQALNLKTRPLHIPLVTVLETEIQETVYAYTEVN
jgi:hypothetical protein